MGHDVFTQLSLVIVLGTVIAMIMRIIKQPLIIGYILTGVLVGPLMLGLTETEGIFDTFSTIGIALLLFIVGLGLNPQVIKVVGKVSALTSLLQVTLTTIIGYFTSELLGFTRTESLFIGLSLSFSSTIIILKLLSDKKEQNRLYGKITIGILLVEDILATLALLAVASKADGEGLSIIPLLVLALKGLCIGIPLYLISTKLLPKMHRFIAGSQEFLFMLAIGWGFGTAALFEQIGFSLEVGALFAGVCWAGLPYAAEVGSRLRPLRDFFVILFFVVLGSRLDFGLINDAMPLIVVGTLIVVFLKPLFMMTFLGLQAYTKKTSFKTAVSMTQISEFGLILTVLAQREELLRSEIVTGLTVIALISTAVSAYLIMYSEKLYGLFENRLSMFEQRKTKFEQEYRANYELVLVGYQHGGPEFVRVFEELSKKYVVIDYDPDVIDVLEKRKIPFLYGDVTDSELLEEANIPNAKMLVSLITDHEATEFLVRYVVKQNPRAVVICHAETAHEATRLYELGASYVILPHYIGSEKISGFIRKARFRKSEFKKHREKHLEYLERHFGSLEEELQHNTKLGHALMHELLDKKNNSPE